jgi:cytochrome c-type biogenesis protein CcmE
MIDDGLQLVADAARAQMRLDVVAAWALAGVVGFAVLFATMRRSAFDVKIGGSLLVLGAVAGALLWSSLQPAAAYRYEHVDELLAGPQRFRLTRPRLQVHGFVVPGSIERRLGTDEYRFRMQSGPDRPHAVLAVRYTGLVPDTFHSGAEIVATGTLVGDGGLDVVPDGIMAKCPTMDFAPPEPEWQAAAPGP